MANPLYQSMNGQPNIMQMVQQIRQNPAQYISQRFNVPEQMMNNPNQILQHLVNSGQVPQARINQAVQMARRFGLIR